MGALLEGLSGLQVVTPDGATREITIRPFAAADRTAVLAIGQAVIDDGTTFPFLEVGGVDRYWFHPESEVWVAELDGEVVGSYALKPNLPGRGDHICNAGYMVVPSHRGRGIGRALAVHSLARARTRGFEAMQYNHVISTNPAVKLWESLGFAIVGEVPDAFRLPQDKRVSYYVMHRQL